MRIGILIPSLGDTGMARAAAQLSIMLDQLSHEVHIITGYRHTPMQNYEGKLHMLDVKPAMVNQSFPERIMLFLKRLTALRKLRRMLKTDVMISFSEAMSIQNILTAGDEGVIISHHTLLSRNENLQDIYGKLVKFLIKLLYSRADLIVPVSEKSASDLVRNFSIDPELIRVIPNPVPVEEIERMASEDLEGYHEIFKDPVIINAGRLTHAKGQRYLLRIFRELLDDFPDLKLVILGDGELRDSLLKFSRELGLKVCHDAPDSGDFQVYFLGFQKNPYRFFSRSKLFVLTSLREALPMAIMEAMSVFLPAVPSDCGGTREILAPGTDPDIETSRAEFAAYGVLLPVFRDEVEAGDKLTEPEKVWIQALRRILQDPSMIECYSRRASSRMNDFRWEKIRGLWESLLDDFQFR